MYSIYVVILLFFSPSDAIARGLGVVGIPLERLFLCFEGCLVYNSPSYIGSGRIPFFFYSFPHSSFFSFFICVSQYEEEKERKKNRPRVNNYSADLHLWPARMEEKAVRAPGSRATRTL